MFAVNAMVIIFRALCNCLAAAVVHRAYLACIATATVLHGGMLSNRTAERWWVVNEVGCAGTICAVHVLQYAEAAATHVAALCPEQVGCCMYVPVGTSCVLCVVKSAQELCMLEL
jgi:hypothetical protein